MTDESDLDTSGLDADERQALICRLADVLHAWAIDLQRERERRIHWDDAWPLGAIHDLAADVETVQRHVTEALARKQERPS